LPNVYSLSIIPDIFAICTSIRAKRHPYQCAIICYNEKKKGESAMYLTLAVSLIIVALILALAVITTSKAYEYKHTIDPSPEEDHSQNK
jgi:uncharacterized membrane protein YidH (DUF202 family)